MRRTSFDRLARGIVGTTLATIGAGCGSGIDTTGMSLPPCDGETQAFALLENLSLPEGYDSLDLAVVNGNGEPPEITATIGERCASAEDLAACGRGLRDIFAPDDPIPVEGFQLGQCFEFCDVRIIVATRGDDVILIQDADAVRTLLGAIDTPTEVVWAVSLEGYNIGCDPEKFGIREANDGYEAAATRLTSGCDPIETTQYLLSVGADASVSALEESVIESESGCVGRRPAGLAGMPGRGRTEIGARLAALAHLEAASVPAFRILQRELADHGAPRSLRLAARQAKHDEVRHARDMRRHAGRFGGRPEGVRVAGSRRRALVDIAIENAREGCVREAYGAIVARFQAVCARDVALRGALEGIARDEAAHAELARRVDAWARRRLVPAERARVEAARREAIDELRAQLDADDPGAAVSAALGLPRPAEARILFTAFEAALG